MRASIYLVTNRLNGKTYVGVTRFCIEQRWKGHVSLAGRTPRSWLHRSIAKHGPEAFTVVQIASCLDLATARDVERDVIDAFRPDYNQTAGGEHTVGRRAPPEVIAKIRASNTGKKRTDEQNAAMSLLKRDQLASRPEYLEAARKNFLKAVASVDREKQKAAASHSSRSRVWSDESRAKLSASCIGRRHSFGVIDSIRQKKKKAVECTTLHAAFDSVSEAAEATGLSISGVSSVCRGKRTSANGLVFSFA